MITHHPIYHFNYPKEILILWEEVLAKFQEFHKEIEALITFGSFTNGDFYFVEVNNQIKILSDFEFSVIVHKNITNDIKTRILKSVESYNEEHSSSHFGHNLNIKVNTANQFYNAINEFHFFNKTIQKTGKVIYGNKDFLDNEILTNNRIPKEEIRYIYNQKIFNLLLHTNSNLVKNQMECPIFIFHLLINTSLKLLYVLSTYFGLYPNSYENAISHLKKFVPRHIIDNYETILGQKKLSIIPSDTQIISTIQTTTSLFNFTYNQVFNKNMSNDEESNDLRNFVNEYLNSLNITTLESKVETQKNHHIESFLKNKGDNYNFYKKLYKVNV